MQLVLQSILFNTQVFDSSLDQRLFITMINSTQHILNIINLKKQSHVILLYKKVPRHHKIFSLETETKSI